MRALLSLSLAACMAFSYDYCYLNRTYSDYEACGYMNIPMRYPYEYNAAGVDGTFVNVARLGNYRIFEDKDANVYLAYETMAYGLVKKIQLLCLNKEENSKMLDNEAELGKYLKDKKAVSLTNPTYNNYYKFRRYTGKVYTVTEATIRFDDGSVMAREFITVKHNDLLD